MRRKNKMAQHVGNSSVPEVAEFLRQAHEDMRAQSIANYRFLAKLGIITRDTDEGDAFLAWGRFIDDPAIIFKNDHEAVVAAMTPAERIALRDRVCGVSQISARA
jgi:hypothetical protein